MLKLIAYGQEYECNRAVKDGNTLSLYKDGIVYCKFSGISDFSGYSLENEEGNTVDFELPEPPAEQQQLAELTLKQAQQDAMLANLQQTNAQLLLQLAQTGGSVNV